jgi:hypothetical protein
MAQVSARSPVAVLDDYALELWALALLLFVVGDVVTTGIGYRMEGVFEASPLPAMLLAQFGVLALLGLKVAVVGVCYLMWIAVPREYAVGIPLGMALLGGVATGWNTTVLLSAS